MPGLTPQDRRVLVVEDEAMIALLMEEMLTNLGYQVVGPVGKLEAASKLVREVSFQAAILDVNIRGGDIFPVAAILMERGIPFVLASGYGEWALPAAFRTCLRLPKPFTPAELQAAAAALFELDIVV